MKTTRQLIAELGINESQAIRNMKRRTARAMAKDRPKVFATSDASLFESSYLLLRKFTKGQVQQDFTSLRVPGSTDEYVAAWCRLNHLLA